MAVRKLLGERVQRSLRGGRPPNRLHDEGVSLVREPAEVRDDGVTPFPQVGRPEQKGGPRSGAQGRQDDACVQAHPVAHGHLFMEVA
jgi:hypothetical protein